jgi:hypothetical protein
VWCVDPSSEGSSLGLLVEISCGGGEEPVGSPPFCYFSRTLRSHLVLRDLVDKKLLVRYSDVLILLLADSRVAKLSKSWYN